MACGGEAINSGVQRLQPAQMGLQPSAKGALPAYAWEDIVIVHAIAYQCPR
jgi:hypothetical protein